VYVRVEGVSKVSHPLFLLEVPHATFRNTNIKIMFCSHDGFNGHFGIIFFSILKEMDNFATKLQQ
jgi:hypothetical protein